MTTNYLQLACRVGAISGAGASICRTCHCLQADSTGAELHCRACSWGLGSSCPSPGRRRSQWITVPRHSDTPQGCAPLPCPGPAGGAASCPGLSCPSTHWPGTESPGHLLARLPCSSPRVLVHVGLPSPLATPWEGLLHKGERSSPGLHSSRQGTQQASRNHLTD